jgi:hypothetical protein
VDGPETERERHGGPQRRVGRGPEHRTAILRPLHRGRRLAVADAIRLSPHGSAVGESDARRREREGEGTAITSFVVYSCIYAFKFLALNELESIIQLLLDEDIIACQTCDCIRLEARIC